MRFAHLSDIHLGFQKHEALQKIEQQVFEKAIVECSSRIVVFILIPGDLFHVNIPEMRVQKFAFAKFRQVHDAKIPIYVVYGSHDFSPVANSVIDLLVEVGYITKVTLATSLGNGRIKLGFLVDKKTGVKIAGLSGLKVGKDREYYEKLDRESLEAESGFKIFLFHGG
ncbi:MAG: DNA repair exonuclease, partial [Nitrosarchaeum sp.]|nr:DNA repair exonuclease [Nitrosarchaeum sp.]